MRAIAAQVVIPDSEIRAMPSDEITGAMIFWETADVMERDPSRRVYILTWFEPEPRG